MRSAVEIRVEGEGPAGRALAAGAGGLARQLEVGLADVVVRFMDEPDAPFGGRML